VFKFLKPTGISITVMVGLALIPGYLMLGSAYLIIKTVGPVQERAYRDAFWSGLAVLGFMAVVRQSTAPGNFSKVHRGIFVTT
jgi:cytochrome bd-type quinol oxidase subunit 2